MSLRDAVLWPFRQVGSALTNFFDWLVNRLGPRDVIPPSVRDTVVWNINLGAQTLGWGTPGDQVESSAILAVEAFLASFISFGATLVLVAVFAITFAIGLLRFIPVVDRYYPFGDTPPEILVVG